MALALAPAVPNGMAAAHPAADAVAAAMTDDVADIPYGFEALDMPDDLVAQQTKVWREIAFFSACKPTLEFKEGWWWLE